MNLPTSFLLGIGVLLAYPQFQEPLPGHPLGDTADTWRYTALIVLLAVPAISARLLGRWFRNGVGLRARLPRSAFRLLSLPGLLIPAVYAVWVFAADYPATVTSFAPSSSFLQHALLLSPLLTMEVSTRLAEAGNVRFLERMRGLAINHLGPRRLPMALFVISPILVFSLVADLVLADRRLQVFFEGTAVGSSLGVLLMAVGLCICLPMFFRWTQPTSRKLPPHLAADIQDTARTLGFSPSNVLVLHSGRRIVNAAMVGPLPWPRYLVLSDGILALLDRSALRGVIAHEVGHARANHPGLIVLLFIVIPVLLLHPILLLDVGEIGSSVLTVSAALAALVGILVIRRVAHQFEFEADRMSAEAFGDAGPCIDALTRVGDMDPSHRTRSSFRHPSETERVTQLLAWERNDTNVRDSMRAKSRRIRLIVAGLTLGALLVSAVVHLRLWSFDRAVYSLYTGDIASAKADLSALKPDPPFLFEADLNALRQEVSAASMIVGDGGPGQWESIRDPLAQGAWERAQAALLEPLPPSSDSVQAAVQGPWFDLALVGSNPSPLVRTLAMWAQAQRNDQHTRALELAEHALTLSPPPKLGVFLRDSITRGHPGGDG